MKRLNKLHEDYDMAMEDYHERMQEKLEQEEEERLYPTLDGPLESDEFDSYESEQY